MKRRILKLVLFLLLGAIINIAVACGCVKWSPDPLEYTSGSGSWPIAQPSDWPAESHWACVTSLGLTESIAYAAVSATPTSRSQRWNQWTFQAGLPFRALCCRRHTTGLSKLGFSLRADRTGNIAEGIVVHFGPAARQRTRWIPTVPIWPGFAINTMFYAAIVWMLIPFPVILRRLIRAHRGRCTACGYDLRGTTAQSDVCPECGRQKI